MLVEAFMYIKITLTIKAYLIALKTPPASLLIIPRAAKSTIFVSSFPAKEITKTMTIKVTAKAARLVICSLQLKAPDKNAAA